MKTITVDNKEVKMLEKAITPVVAAASKIATIKNDNELGVATEMLSKLNQYADSVKAEKKKLTDPANATLKAIKSLFAPLEDKVLPRIEAIRNAMMVYQTEKANAARIEDAKIAARVGEGKGKIKVDTAMKKMDEVDRPLAKIATESGGLRFRETPRLKIVDESKIPREYLVVDEKKTLDALKAGAIIPGAEIELVQVPVNSR
jgi:hypothetical protein